MLASVKYPPKHNF